ncbi:MAG: hypothetical protein GTO45_04560 [Candidatus Aminicenantes bacterium]|nr:hypothetical protein [Candidatus Aminicenantes bacterium]NIM78023.1 hypothetical protein [Candidatus Aminicenantes bacterium]NIN17343.1 hypothetical protein [Candidatus Aminicenantes bacterium]NIN41236.1 hypothetical protein [Candidatus Aminicenantes bacterium]NIN84009.1 hypothetical protein [Candidatus Aminicenantes bacterium]
MIEGLERSTFDPYLNKKFEIHTESSRVGEVELVEVIGNDSNSSESFSLVFWEKFGTQFGQNTYKIIHPEMGEFELFLVPIDNKGKAGFYYQAVNFMWKTPVYKLQANDGKDISIDVTSSCAPGLKANKVIKDIARFLKKNELERILDFGAGALRHTFPLLRRSFQVCAVEFEKQFQKKSCKNALKRAKRSANFSALIFPNGFIEDKRKFDAAILSFVVPTMPIPEEREALLRLISDKLEEKSLIFWMSQFGKYNQIKKDSIKVNDGWYLNPKRTHHSFYTEFTNEQIDNMMKAINFIRIRSLSDRGTDQFRVFSRNGVIKWQKKTRTGFPL